MEKKFKESPVFVDFGFADLYSDRLDAVVSYGPKHFEYIEESKWARFFNINPAKFLKKVEAEFEKMHNEYFGKK